MSFARANYPGKRKLSKSEAMGVLRHGADPRWFEPWAEHGVLLADREVRYGLVHVCGGTDEALTYDVRMFWDREGLSWALEMLHNDHPRCGDECIGLFYFAPDEPLRLQVVIEQDDLDDEEDGDQ